MTPPNRPQPSRTLVAAVTSKPSADGSLTVALTLTPDQLDALADAVAARLQPAPVATLVDAQTVADALGVSRDTIYAHADRLGGRRIGDGKRPRLRFDLDQALAAWTRRSVDDGSLDPKSPTVRAVSRRRRGAGKGSGRRLLPIHGGDDAG